MTGNYSPEQRLWQAVIVQAMVDLAGKARSVESKLTPAQLVELEQDAADWFREAGPDYIDVCANAGWQPKKLTSFAERLEQRDDDAIDTLLRLRSHLLHRGALSEKGLEI